MHPSPGNFSPGSIFDKFGQRFSVKYFGDAINMALILLCVIIKMDGLYEFSIKTAKFWETCEAEYDEDIHDAQAEGTAFLNF